jgi:hypothetical protein
VSRRRSREGFVYTGRHAHDLFLQTWYELGVVGALLMAIAVALSISRLPFEAQPFTTEICGLHGDRVIRLGNVAGT